MDRQKDSKQKPHHKISRRTFLKASGVTGASLATVGVVGTTQKVMNNPEKVFAAENIEYETFRSTCAMECLHCNLTAYVKDGKLIKVEASKDFNVTGCLRGMSRSQWVNNPNRLKKPLLRTGKKGEGKFKEISWDEALDLVVEKLNETRKKYGNKGILFETASGNMDSIKNSIGQAFFSYLGGVTTPAGSLCCSAVTAAMEPIVGFRYIDTRDTIKDSKYLLCWGNNPAVTMQAYFKEYEKAMDEGARLVVLDPRFSETASKADEWIPIVPSTDTALALAMLNIIIEENLIDRDFLTNHTGATYLVDKKGDLIRENVEDPDSYLVYDLNTKTLKRHDAAGIKPLLSSKEANIQDGYRTVFDLIAAEAAIWTLEKTEKETDVPKETILRLAREYATIKPAMIIQNMSGAQRTEYGTYAVASQFYLALFTGNIGKPGAGVCDAGGATQLAKFNPPVAVPESVENLPCNQGYDLESMKIPHCHLGAAIVNEEPTKIDFWYMMTCSPMTQVPNTNMVKKALEKVSFAVVVDNLMTSTALYADLILPTTTVFEDVSLMAGPRSHYVQLMEKAVEPPGEAKPDYWIFAQLAKRLGFGEAFDKPIEELIETVLDGTGLTIEQLKKGPIKPVATPYVAFTEGKFRTSTGKAHFYVEAWKEHDYKPIVTYIQADELIKNKSSKLRDKYPLMAVQRKLARSIHSSFSTLPWVNEVHSSEPEVMIHPNDAKKRGIKANDRVIIYNDRGEHRAKANVTYHIKEGIISLENGWWEQSGGSTSYVTNDKVDVLGNGHTCNNTLVEIRKES